MDTTEQVTQMIEQVEATGASATAFYTRTTIELMREVLAPIFAIRNQIRTQPNFKAEFVKRYWSAFENHMKQVGDGGSGRAYAMIEANTALFGSDPPCANPGTLSASLIAQLNAFDNDLEPREFLQATFEAMGAQAEVLAGFAQPDGFSPGGFLLRWNQLRAVYNRFGTTIFYSITTLAAQEARA
jgi:hypothetical protein